MQISLFLARLIGPWMAIMGLAVLVDRPRFRDLASEFVEHPALLFLSSFVLLPAGIAIVLVHNIWIADWRVLITLFGWLLTLSSAIRLLAPKFVAFNARKVLASSTLPFIAGAIWLLIGLTFCFFGFR